MKRFDWIAFGAFGIVAATAAVYLLHRRVANRAIPVRAESIWNEELARLKQTPNADPSVVAALETLQSLTSGKVTVDRNCGGACTRYCTDDPSAVEVCGLELDPDIVRSAVAQANSNSLARTLFISLLIKEGETMRVLRAKPREEYEAYLLQRYFDALRQNKTPENQLTIRIDGQSVTPEADIVANLLICKLTDLECDGFLVMARYLKENGLTVDTLARASKTEKDAVLKAMIDRAQNVLRTAPTAKDQPAGVPLRYDAMGQEIREGYPDVWRWVRDRVAEQHGGWLKYQENADDFNFLADQKLINATVTAYELPKQ